MNQHSMNQHSNVELDFDNDLLCVCINSFVSTIVEFAVDEELTQAASVNVMPKSLFDHLNLADLKETNMMVEMADMKKGPIRNCGKYPRIGEEKVKFDMNGGICHSRVLFEKIYMASSVQESEYFNPLEIKTDVFSYDSLACLLFEKSTHPCSNESIDTVDSSDDMHELEGSQEDEVGSHLLENIVSRWYVCKPVYVTIKDCEKDYGKWPTCNPDLSFCSGYDAIYGKKESGMLKQWICFQDHERHNVAGNRMIFADFLKVRYKNKNIDDVIRE
ncbi:hypothetical protein Tco_0933695 [Tanacetum coccineum]